MSSILTNTSALVALQTLKTINAGMAKVQDEVSTGLKVATAKDNGAVWSIAQVMRSDVSSLGKVQEALALGSATVGTGRTAAESISDMLTTAKEAVLGAGDLSNQATRDKLVADLQAIGAQIADIVASASFNGVNLINNTLAADPAVIGSITRDTAGAIGTETITVARQDLTAVDDFLAGIAEGDLDTQAEIDTALTSIEADLTTVNSAAAAFGTVQKQIDIQSKFVGNFINALKTGIGAMVDADMEEASARLQALQVQQQLGIQSLSIANQAPQNVLALFR
jgi:flagellin